MTHNTLSHPMDKIGFELISKRQPKTIQAIENALARGATARQVEKRLHRLFGRNHVTVALIVGAAYYLEAQREQKQSEVSQ